MLRVLDKKIDANKIVVEFDEGIKFKKGIKSMTFYHDNDEIILFDNDRVNFNIIEEVNYLERIIAVTMIKNKIYDTKGNRVDPNILHLLVFDNLIAKMTKVRGVYFCNAKDVEFLDKNIRDEYIDEYKELLKNDNFSRTIEKINSKYLNFDDRVDLFVRSMTELKYDNILHFNDTYFCKLILGRYRKEFIKAAEKCFMDIKVKKDIIYMLSFLMISFIEDKDTATRELYDMIVRRRKISNPLNNILSIKKSFHRLLEPSLFPSIDDYNSAVNVLEIATNIRQFKAHNVISIIKSYPTLDYNFQLLVRYLYCTDIAKDIGYVYITKEEERDVYSRILNTLDDINVNISVIKKIINSKEGTFNYNLSKYLSDNLSDYSNLKKK